MTDFISSLFRRKSSADAAPAVKARIAGNFPDVKNTRQIVIGTGQSVGIERSHNEDALLVLTGQLTGTHPLPNFGLFIVADGMGGHRAGEIASAVSIRTVARMLTQETVMQLLKNDHNELSTPLQDLLREALEEANRAVVEEVPGGGTTLTAAIMLGPQLTIGHVGDTRAYYIRDGKAEILTRDRGVPPNPDLAHKHYHASFLHYRKLLDGFVMPITLTRLGVIYEHGQGVERSYGIASRYYLESAWSHEIEGVWKVAELYGRGLFEASDSGGQAFWQDRLESLLAEAEGGDTVYQYQLGRMYSVNRIVPPDYAKSAHWFSRAVEENLITACLPLGEHYEFGRGVTRDESRALELYLEAASAAGDERARYRAAVLLLSASRDDHGPQEAKELLEGQWNHQILGRLMAGWLV
ncbi:MAG: protein phosphatase 2C domain-containing protein, partial [Anaerolineales bacterium]